MSARKKLNSTHVCGSVFIACAIGAIAGSWWLFFILLAVLLACNFYDGSIRLKQDQAPR